MAREILPIRVLGASFSIQTDEPREYMDTLVSEMERRLEALRAATRVDDPLKLAILECLSLLDELTRLRGQAAAGEEISRIAERLLGKLDAGLIERSGAPTRDGSEPARLD